MSALREGVLGGRTVAIAGRPDADPLAIALTGLGARTLTPQLDAEEPGTWASAHGPVHALVFDAAASFHTGDEAGLMATLDAAWVAVHELAADLIATSRPGKLLLIGPPPAAGPLAGAARDGLENLARTLSVEWARYGITTCALAPGDATTPEQLGELVAYLLSPAGDYFTGCRLTLGAVDQACGSSAQGTITASS